MFVRFFLRLFFTINQIKIEFIYTLFFSSFQMWLADIYIYIFTYSFKLSATAISLHLDIQWNKEEEEVVLTPLLSCTQMEMNRPFSISMESGESFLFFPLIKRKRGKIGNVLNEKDYKSNSIHFSSFPLEKKKKALVRVWYYWNIPSRFLASRISVERLVHASG